MNWRRQKALYGAMPVPVATMMNTALGSSGMSRILPVGPAQRRDPDRRTICDSCMCCRTESFRPAQV